MRRFTRLTNAFSKKVENHAVAVALHFIHYDFARIHETLSITPAMAAGIADHVWSYEDIASLANESDGAGSTSRSQSQAAISTVDFASAIADTCRHLVRLEHHSRSHI
jgi:hypothetical protein